MKPRALAGFGASEQEANRPTLRAPQLGPLARMRSCLRTLQLKRVVMNLHIRSVRDDDMDDLVRLSLLAWAPVFRSFKRVLGPNIYALIWPDWRTSQAEVVEKICKDGESTTVWVAELDGKVIGFLACELNNEDKTGEVQLLAVHPEYQNRGIGTELNVFALEKMKESGMKLAVVATGGDPGHAPARRSYEKAGYTGLPLVRYYKDLREHP
jgi:ribosomal protein S18 acetylase RimI-like enzyme